MPNAIKRVDIDNLATFKSGMEDWMNGPHVELTQEQYNSLSSEQKNNGTVYFVTDAASSGGIIVAGDVMYNNSSSGLAADDVQSAIDEVVVGLGTAASKNVAASGDASTTEVVMGDDSRLTDARTPVAHSHTISDITDFPASMPASDVSAWAKESTKPTYTASEVGAVATTSVGAASGVAELDANGKVPSSQLPSFVDDVIEGYLYEGSFYEDAQHTEQITGEASKIYVDLATDSTYRWGGSAFSPVGSSLALGETSTTAYRGDRGKTAYDHSQVTSGNPHNVTKSDVGLGNVGNFKAVSTEASQGLSSTEQANARANIGAGTSSFDGAYSSLTGTPTLGTAAAKASTNAVTQNSTDLVESGAVYTGLSGKANGAGLTFSVDQNGILCVTY